MSQLAIFTKESIQKWKYNLLQAELTKAQEQIQALKYSQRSYKGGATKRKKK